ncbi:hypothetical protein ECPA39_4754, partial [Escherichia coli PA39]
MASAPV